MRRTLTVLAVIVGAALITLAGLGTALIVIVNTL
jgi:hypothetical protein